MYLLIPHHLNYCPPPPPISGKGYPRKYPLSRVLVTFCNYKKHPLFLVLSENRNFPRLRPKIRSSWGGGGHSTLIWTGVPLGDRKPDPVSNRSVHKKYTLSQYTLLKLSYAYPVLVRTDSVFCCVSSYIHKNRLRPARAVSWCRDHGPVINIVDPHAPSLVPRSRACHKHCGLGPGWEAREATL